MRSFTSFWLASCSILIILLLRRARTKLINAKAYRATNIIVNTANTFKEDSIMAIVLTATNSAGITSITVML